MKLKFTFFFIILLFSLVRTNAQNISNEGTEFWLCFPSHVPASGQLASISVFITSKSNTSGVVTCGSFSQTFNVTANAVTEVIVDRGVSYIFDGTGISFNKGIKVLINQGQPKAVVYGHIFAGARSAATLVLPKLALGQKYYAISYRQTDGGSIGFSQMQIVCVEPNTVLRITPRLNGIAQNTFSITLNNIGDVYQYQNSSDITGTYVEVDATSSSCKRFAAFSGSSALAIFSLGCNPPGGNSTGSNPSFDPLFQQLYPLESWGKVFPLIPFFDRNTGTIYRVLASEDNTQVTVAGGAPQTINRGQFIQTNPLNIAGLITANKPVTVAQYALTQYCADSRNFGRTTVFSDPDMVIINPLEYSIKQVTMYSALKEDIANQYLNVMIPTTGVATFTLNGVSFSNRFSVVTGTIYSFAQIDLRQIGGNSFSLKSEFGFNAMAYGFGAFESYAYSAGTNLASSIFINAVRPQTNEIISNACRDEKFDFRLVLPYISDKLIWTLDAGDNPIVQDKPTFQQIIMNGNVLYEYRLPVDKVYNTVGIKNIQIISTIPPSAGGCPSGDETLNFEFDVFDPPPTATFLAQKQACIGNTVKFSLNAINGTRPVIQYLWDFGDGTFSNDKEPSHVFTTGGIKTVSLSVKNDVACVSNVYQLPIEVLLQPVAAFGLDAVSCTNQDIKFTNQSQLNGNNATFLWNFGDGTTSTLQNPTHQYAANGNYTITLSVKSDAQCESITTKSKTIFTSPSVQFQDPNACVSDNIEFIITQKSSDIVSYQWNFGNTEETNDVSNLEKPTYTYTKAGIYDVSLIVINANGCQTRVTRSVTISSANPKSSFEVLNKDNLCSNQPVSFKDLSSVTFGNIVKLEWIYDYSLGGTNTITTVNNPVKNDTYTFKYPSLKDDKVYQVRLRAYSGNDCFSDFGPIDITVKGSPNINFAPIASVCASVNKFRLLSATEVNGISGNGKYTGVGVTSDGFFDPAISGAGTFEITYTFLATNGCSDVKKQNVIIFPEPVVDAGNDQVILVGGQVTLDATASGIGLTYQWLPTDGLDDPKALNPISTPSATTKYTLVVTTSDGCQQADQVTVTIAPFPKIPDTFTPNGDGVNDNWNIKYLNTYKTADIRIFNRFGNEVFSSTGYDNPWDGKTRGKDVPVGVYYYVINTKNTLKEKFTGSITVIR
jgi:gliding motility-associated-like protein